MSNAQHTWLRLQEALPHTPKDTINGHSPPRAIPRYMLRGKSVEEVKQMLSQGELLFLPANGRFTGTVKHKYAVRKNRY